jgi:fibronectin type 3 domain-containing protein
VLGYLVYRAVEGGNLSPLTGSVTTSTSFTDSTVASGRTYLYAVRSVDSGNVESANSNEVTVTIP